MSVGAHYRGTRAGRGLARKVPALLLSTVALACAAGPAVLQEGRRPLHPGAWRSQSVYVYDVTDDREVISVNGDQRRAPASLAKLMTTYVALRHVDDLSSLAPVSSEAYARAVTGNCSMAGFVPGERTTFRDLMYATMLASGGEAAMSLAENACGSTDACVAEMNEVAGQWGLRDTSYRNVEGLDAEGQHTTARDVASLVRHALEDGNFRTLFCTPQFGSSPTTAHPDGVLLESTVLSKLGRYDTRGFTILGGKSGTTGDAGLCWATLAEKGGHRYIVVVMGAPIGDLDSPDDGQIVDTLDVMRSL